jgi:leucyl aminopeptidase (aminopeptidase T)
MVEYYEFELGKAADILVRDLFEMKPGETFVITADTESDTRVVEATARAAFSAGAKPMVIWLASPLGVGKAADPMLPEEALVGALNGADAWVEFNNQWLLYSTAYDRVMNENKRLRYLCLVGMNVDMMVRCIGRIDYTTLAEFITTLSEMTVNAKEIRVTTPAGTDVVFQNMEGATAPLRGFPNKPGSHMMAGQIGWRIVRESVNGKIVFDGSLVPPIGLLKEPVTLHVKDGQIMEIEGGSEAVQYEAWLKSFDNHNMLRIAHICWSFNPGAKLTGDIVEDERVWGSSEWGIGNHPGMPAPSHSDGICLNSSVWMDGEQILDEGRSIHPKLAELARKLGKQ